VPRRNRKSDEPPATRRRQLARNQPTSAEEISDRLLGDEALLEGFVVKGSIADSKRYLCPWCNGWIEPGVRHVVAYPSDRLDERRHYHRGCWQRRAASER